MKQQPGYYPKFSTLKQQNFWDEVTRKLVVERVEKVPEVLFFSPSQVRCLEAVFARILPQDDRTPDRRIPILNAVDSRLYSGRIEGYRYDTMPADERAYTLGVEAINCMAQDRYARDFADLSTLAQEALLASIHDGIPWAAEHLWRQIPTHNFWAFLVNDAVSAYYAHPWAWDEIGFGGPAYPRGYMRLERGLPEPWETDEERYEWSAPADTLSDVYRKIGGAEQHGGPAGSGGSHGSRLD